MNYTQNLRLKGVCYHFRKRIPDKLRNRVGRYEVVRSLETSDYKIAGRRARLVWLRLQGILDWVADDITLTKGQIDEAMERFARQIDWADEVRMAQSGAMFDHHGYPPPDADALVLETMAYDHQAALARNDTSGVRGEIERVKAGFGHSLTTMDEHLLGRAILGVLASSGERAAKHLRDTVYPHLFPDLGEVGTSDDDAGWSAVQAAPALETPSPPLIVMTGYTFEQAWLAAMDDNMTAKKWKKDKVDHINSTLKLWIRVHGDSDLAEVTPQKAVAFRKTVAQLPVRYHRDKTWQGMSVADIVAATNAADALDEEEIIRIDTKTVNRHISTLKTTWITFQTLKYLPTTVPNPFEGLHINVSKATEDIQEERDQFTLEEIKVLFASPVWQGCQSWGRRKFPGKFIMRDWCYWVPLLGAYTGMRREEICALKIQDFEKVDGIWIINLRKAKERYKTPGSSRYVPVHKHLIEWGFVAELVENRAPDAWLFPDLKPNLKTGKFGSRFGKWFTPLRMDLGIYRPEVVFHSFRHTVSTELKNAQSYVPFIEEITGHESGERRSELRRYAKPALVALLKETIDRLDYGLHFPTPGPENAPPPRRVRQGKPKEKKTVV
ncbi:site-specific integrase [Devosia sp.]|uniref:site-specific integrase n=1 Tax=Devosia sp. TaxID=1871048 RepID=UPI0032649683